MFLKKKLMKPQHFFYYLAIITVLFSACKKDYRDKWVGNWNFEVKSTSWSMEMDAKIDSFYFSGKISLGDNFDQLYINFEENYSLLVTVDESGKISNGGSYYTDGQLGKEKVYIKIITGTHGYRSEYAINGIKKRGGEK